VEGGAVRNLESAAIAPVIVLAVRGMILGGGNGPVYGILIRRFCIEEWVWALKRRGSESSRSDPCRAQNKLKDSRVIKVTRTAAVGGVAMSSRLSNKRRPAVSPVQ
jgi:hypothetical protein